MRRKIAAANWKMNLTLDEGMQLLTEILNGSQDLKEHQSVVFALPFPYLGAALEKTGSRPGFAIAAQNCHFKDSGAYTGEVSAKMLASIGIKYCVIGHSERREYFQETHQELAEKIRLCLQYGLCPIFCCGEPLSVREENGQEEYVRKQLEESIFSLDASDFEKLIIAYEPIWAIGTGKTATAAQAQEIHAAIRQAISEKFGDSIARDVSILYGGSVKGNNAEELFSMEDVDGGLVGGASLSSSEFLQIIAALP